MPEAKTTAELISEKGYLTTPGCLMTIVKCLTANNIDTNDYPYAVGGTAWIFALPDNPSRMLRIEFDHGNADLVQQQRQNNIELVQRLVPSLIPTIHQYRFVPGSTRFGWVEIMVMDRLDIVDWASCHKTGVAGGGVELVYKLFDVVKTLMDKDIYHRDMSPANFVLTQSGDIKMIDFGDICVPKYENADNPKTYCNDPPNVTNGYNDPRVQADEDDETKGRQIKLLHMLFRDRSIDVITQAINDSDFSPNAYNVDRYKEFVMFGAGAIALYILTQSDPLDITANQLASIPFDVLQVIRAAMDPIPSNRSLVTPHRRNVRNVYTACPPNPCTTAPGCCPTTTPVCTMPSTTACSSVCRVPSRKTPRRR